jgi:peptidoglycan/LPS O-acetylase OafA/YrhL
MPLHEYFRHKEFSHYLLNIIGYIHYGLPGVFDSNPFPRQVNGSLWTVPYEIGCYAIMSGLILFGLVKSSRAITATFVSFTMLYFAMSYWYSFNASPLTSNTPVNNYLNNFLSKRGNFLYFHFLAGSLVYVFREHIPYSKSLLISSLGIIVASTFGVFGVATTVIMSLPIAYVTVFIGLTKIPRVPLYARGDYSYGVYLYAYPLQQMLVERLPNMVIAQHFVLSMILVTGVAMVSWHCIEKPILKIRKRFSFTARKGDHVCNLPTSGNA